MKKSLQSKSSDSQASERTRRGERKIGGRSTPDQLGRSRKTLAELGFLPPPKSPKKILWDPTGAGEGIRTLDPNLGKVVV
jgi:hypothetical protein